jgi:hypothetical protein
MLHLSRRVDIVLHIGTGKTGTSSIQALLAQNRGRLADLGCLYPRSPGRRRHTALSHFVKPSDALEREPSWRRRKHSSPAKFREDFERKLLTEIDRSGLPRVLMSDEALYGSPTEALQQLHSFTERIARSLQIVVYLRRQDDHLISRYQQVVKVGETRRLEERTRELDLSSTYDYYSRLTTWREILKPAAFVVRRFEPPSFVSGSLYQDFLDAAGLDISVDALERVRPVNESLDAECVEFLRLLNIYRVEHEGATRGQINNRDLVTRLSKTSAGPVLSLPTSVLDEFMMKWEDSNQQVARDFLDEPAGHLFRTPRKTTDVTREQRLDPARLGYFFDVSELPGEIRAPLRKIAEREARVR